jgi:hypothetical protein
VLRVSWAGVLPGFYSSSIEVVSLASRDDGSKTKSNLLPRNGGKFPVSHPDTSLKWPPRLPLERGPLYFFDTAHTSGEAVIFATEPDSTLAAFISRLDGAGMPRFILCMDGTEPPAADAAVECSGSIARLVGRRDGLTGPFGIPGFGLFFFLQHCPSTERRGTHKPTKFCQTRGAPGDSGDYSSYGECQE